MAFAYVGDEELASPGKKKNVAASDWVAFDSHLSISTRYPFFEPTECFDFVTWNRVVK